MLSRAKVLERFLRLSKCKRAIQRRSKLDFVLLEIAIHLFKVGFGPDGDAPAKSLVNVSILVAISAAFDHLLNLCRLDHQFHQPFRLPICVKTFEEANERHGTTSSAQKANIVHERLRAGVVDYKVYTSAVRETLHLRIHIRSGLIVDATNLRVQFLECLYLLFG